MEFSTPTTVPSSTRLVAAAGAASVVQHSHTPTGGCADSWKRKWSTSQSESNPTCSASRPTALAGVTAAKP